MNKAAVFDVLVVYSDDIATSASSTKPSDTKPFSKDSNKENYNDSYAYFLAICKKNKLKAAFTTTKDIGKKGYFNTHWLFEKNKWIKIESPCYAPLIFDKFAPTNQIQKDRRASLFSNLGIEPFNSHEIFSLFFDKQKTYDTLNKFTIPTVTIKNNSTKSINGAVIKLQGLVDAHPGRDDFSRKIIIKNRFGAGGNNIYCTTLNKRRINIKEIVESNKGVSFILQPFAEFEDGYGYKQNSGFTDIRIIYLGKKIIQSYIRTAAKDNFLCNEHQGGKLEYISKNEIPSKIKKMAEEIIGVLNNNNSLFALDFIISNNGNVYLMEGNSRPGLDWNLSLKKNERSAKKLIREIVKMLSVRVNPITIPSNPVRMVI